MRMLWIVVMFLSGFCSVGSVVLLVVWRFSSDVLVIVDGGGSVVRKCVIFGFRFMFGMLVVGMVVVGLGRFWVFFL